MTKRNKRLQGIVYLGLVMLLPLLLFLVEGRDATPGVFSGEGETPRALECDAEEEVAEDKVDYFALIYSIDKDPTFKPGDKTPPEPEPEPEPVVTPAPAPDPVPAPPPAPSSPPSSEDTAPAEEEAVWQSTPSGNTSILNTKELQMFNLINKARSDAGVSLLRIDNQLVHAARAKSKDMVDNNYFSHTSPRYGGLGAMLRGFGISYRSAGENLAMNSNGSVSFAHSNLMSSSGHRANILNSSYNLVGVGIHVRRDGTHFYTQIFIAR